MSRVLRFAGPARPLVGLVATTLLLALALGLALARAALAAPEIPVLWTAGGHDAGNTGAGQAARVAVAPSGNVAVLSAPSLGRDLAVTLYTADGAFLWRRGVTPLSGTFIGDWVAAAPNGDVVAVGTSTNSSGHTIAITLVRYAADGTLLWRVEVPGTRPNVGRLLVDSAGNAYLAFNALGDGQDIRLHKYSPSGGLLWARLLPGGFMSNDIATSLAFSPDESEVAISGNVTGGAWWITALYDTATGERRWLTEAPEGIANRDVVVDENTVYAAGQGNVGIEGYLTVVAYDRATGERLWRTDRRPAASTGAAGLRLSNAPDGSIVVAGQAMSDRLDWYVVVLEPDGSVRWEAGRDGGLNTDEFPRGLLVLPDGTVVVTGRGGPPLPGGFIQGITVGFGPTGEPLWEAYARMESVWAAALPSGDVCAVGGYDALITCWEVPGGAPGPTPTPTSQPMPTASPTPPATPSSTPVAMPLNTYLPTILSFPPDAPRP